MENCIPGSGGRLMVFTGGPCTTGPGTVVGLTLEESIRTHRVHLPYHMLASTHRHTTLYKLHVVGLLYLLYTAADASTCWTYVLAGTAFK